MSPVPNFVRFNGKSAERQETFTKEICLVDIDSRMPNGFDFSSNTVLEQTQHALEYFTLLVNKAFKMTAIYLVKCTQLEEYPIEFELHTEVPFAQLRWEQKYSCNKITTT